MTSRIKISQAGLSAGVAGRARTDGLATGALVTLEDVSGTGRSTFHLIWRPVEDTNAVASLAATVDPDIWTFSPTAAVYGSYLIELREDGVPLERRVFGIRTPANQLLIPALNERASRHAALDNAGADVIEQSENNAADFPLSALNSFRYAGWWRSLYELYRIVEFGTGSIANNALGLIKLAQQNAKTVLVNATNALGNVTALAGTAKLQYLRVNQANNALEFAGLANPDNVNSAATSGSLGVVDISALECGGAVTFQNLSADATIDGFTVKPDGFWFICHVRDSSSGFCIKLLEQVGNATTSILTPDIRDLRLYKNDAVMLFYSNSRWRAVAWMPKIFAPGITSVTWAAQQDDLTRTSATQNVLRVTLTGNQMLTGIVPDNPPSGSGSSNGELLFIENVDAVDTLTVAHQSTASTAANRFTLPNSVPLQIGPGSCALFIYDGTSSRWRLIGSPQQSLVLTQSTALTVTNATTNLTPGALTVPGNAQSAGSEFACSALIHTSRGATATAANVIVEVLVGGAVIRTLTIPTTTTSGHLGSAKIEARYTCRTTGASGSAMVTLRIDEAISNADATPNGNPLLVWHDPIPATTAAAATTVDTTVDQTLEVRARFDTAVANLAMHMYYATIRRDR